MENEPRLEQKAREALAALGLSEREVAVALGFMRGETTAQIAAGLGISRSTVGTYCGRVYDKLGVENRQAADALLADLVARLVREMREAELAEVPTRRFEFSAWAYSACLGVALSSVAALAAFLLCALSRTGLTAAMEDGAAPTWGYLIVAVVCLVAGRSVGFRRETWHYEACAACGCLGLAALAGPALSVPGRSLLDALAELGFSWAVFALLACAFIAVVLGVVGYVRRSFSLSVAVPFGVLFFGVTFLLLSFGCPVSALFIFVIAAAFASVALARRLGESALVDEPPNFGIALSGRCRSYLVLASLLLTVGLRLLPWLTPALGDASFLVILVAAFAALCWLAASSRWLCGDCGTGFDTLLLAGLAWLSLGGAIGWALPEGLATRLPSVSSAAFLVTGLALIWISVMKIREQAGRRRQYCMLEEAVRVSWAARECGIELTRAESAVCGRVVQGYGIFEMAEALFVSKKTVNTHLGNVYRKFDVHSLGSLCERLSALERELVNSL